jgi:glycosyltransferase involved in cell wall biosynthesis
MQNRDVICLSHLRWDFVTQRPQHLLSRFAREQRVFFVEEPVFEATDKSRLEVSRRENGLHVVVPHLPHGLDPADIVAEQRKLIDDLVREHAIESFLLWYYTPMALEFTRHLNATGVAYDCMDELSAFHGAPPGLRALEEELMSRADVVFTGGQTLYEAKRERHPNVHPFPSSIDAAHFREARSIAADPPDQAGLPHPRLGYCGVIDERMDLGLLAAIADARPDWHLVMIGPVVKIDPATLPRRDNIHYLGPRNYQDLPAYLAGWDVALLPFAINESTRYISPTKTPEYLAAGRPVVSTPIRDVVHPYGDEGLARIAGTPGEFIAAIGKSLEAGDEDPAAWIERVDRFLAGNSWDVTWRRMSALLPVRINQQ